MGRVEGPSLIGPGPEWAGGKVVTDRSRTRVGRVEGYIQNLSGRGRGAVTDTSRTLSGRGRGVVTDRWLSDE